MAHQNPNHAMTEAEREAFEERAGIAEFDGGMSREEAEALALEAVMRRRGNPQPSTQEKHHGNRSR